MKRFEFNKLIRNNLPDRMRQEGVILNSSHLSEDEYRKQLKLKLLEEAKEVLEADSVDELAIELSDVLEVIHTLAKCHNLDFADIEKERIKKQAANGTFDAENYINYIEVEETNRRVIEYLLNRKRPYVYTS
jgi:predicted house-cleaning noncanonical NTP pyrophosphatase (MazG superfamily)